jgi:O-antigen/teichoic acid export membrane protein
MTRPTSKKLQWERPRPGRLVQNAIALIISSAGSSTIGIFFWAFAAHLATQAAVGRTTAEIAAMILLTNLAQLSFGSIFERFLPIAGHLTGGFVRRAYTTCLIFAFILATAYVIIGFGHSFLPSAFVWRVLFIVSVVLWTIFALQDSVLIGLRASRWVAVENIAYSIAKLALLPLCVFLSAKDGIFVAWVAPLIFTNLAVTWYLFSRRIPEQMLTPAVAELPATRELIVLAGAQYASLLSSVFVPSVVTLIVIDRLGAVANAHYFLPALIYSSLALFTWGIIRSFLVEASSEPHALRAHANSALRALVVLLVPSVVLGYIFAPEFLGIFGHAYEANGTTLMRMLLLSFPGVSVMIFYSTFAWLDKRVWSMTLRNLATNTLYLVVVILLIGSHGIDAIGIAALVNSAFTVILFLPASIRRYRRTATESTEPLV